MNVILYSTHCPKCEMLEKLLKKQKIRYKESNNVDEMLKLGFTEVPMLKVDDVILNFNQAIKFLTKGEE